MDELLRELRFHTYRLDVLKDAQPSEVRTSQILSAVSVIDRILDSIRQEANNNRGRR
jgi:hypothetical protein